MVLLIECLGKLSVNGYKRVGPDRLLIHIDTSVAGLSRHPFTILDEGENGCPALQTAQEPRPWPSNCA